MPMRIHSDLPDATELVIQRTIGAAIEVHRALGPGLLEGVYSDAMAIELGFRKMKFQTGCRYELSYRGRPLRKQKVDIVVESVLVVELKAVENLHPVHEAQLISYLRASKLRAGLLLNFNKLLMKEGVRRIVN